MPSSRRRTSADWTRLSRIRSPALSWTTTSYTESHSGVAYSGWLPTSRYSRAPFSRNTLLERPHDTTRRNRYRATSSGLSRRCPRSVQVTPYSFSSPKILRSTRAPKGRGAEAGYRPKDLASVVVADDEPSAPMVRLPQMHRSFASRFLLARLADEGIDARMRG